MNVKETIEKVRELFNESETGRIVDVDYLTSGGCISVYLIVVDNHMAYDFWYFKDSNDNIELKEFKILQ